jgi:hypothetical protein
MLPRPPNEAAELAIVVEGAGPMLATPGAAESPPQAATRTPQATESDDHCTAKRAPVARVFLHESYL